MTTPGRTAVPPADDRILRSTRVLAAIIVPFLVAAVALLYVLPSRTDELFAWTIAPSLSAMMLASAYAGGIWFFMQVVFRRGWHTVAAGFPAVILFATLASISTFLHWEKFHFGHISFVTWVVLYVTTPVLVLIVFIRNRRFESRVPAERDVEMPKVLRYGVSALGAGLALVGLVMFIAPELFFDHWAWQLTPLTGRITGAVLILPGLVDIGMLRDARWSSFRLIFQAQLVSLAFIVGAFIIASGDLELARPMTWLVVGGIAATAVGYVGIYVWCERKVAAKNR